MVCSAHSAHVILTLCGFAVFVILRRSHRDRRKKQIPSNDGVISEHDVISKLPDDILISIIMRMRTKDSTSTSILSKRWRNLYKFLPDIEFRCSDLIGCSYSYTYPHNSSKIVKSVDRFLRFRLSGSHKIRSFSFRCCLTKSHTKYFERLIRSLGTSGVEELFLQFRCCYSHSDLSLSCSLFSEIPSLKSLKLVLCYLQPSRKIETQLFMSLQILILHHVDVLPGALESILSNCSSLLTLVIDDCQFEPRSRLFFSGHNLQLKFLYILDCTGIEKVTLCASNLTTFEFKDSYVKGVIFDHVPQLQTIFSNAYLHNILSYVRGKLAEDLPQLKSLAFTTGIDLVEMCKGPVRTNMFRNLRQLDFFLHGTTNMNLLSLILFLQSCPLLQDFHMDASHLTLKEPQEIKQEEIIVLHPELKKVELSGFLGRENELEFALCILKSAVCLELMHISTGDKVYRGFGSWRYYNSIPVNEVRQIMIHERLQGQALSKTARVVVQYEALHEEDKWGRSGSHYDFSTLSSDMKIPYL